MGWFTRRFEQTSELGPGVWKGRDLLADRPVLIKTSEDPALVAALREEWKVSRRCAHDALRRALAFEWSESEAALALDWSPGCSLQPGCSTSEIERAAVATLRALSCLHAVGVVHGDVKPANILVSEHPMLIDLGLSTSMEGACRGGTAGYLAPEVHETGKLNASTDLYGWGKAFEPLAEHASELGMLVARCVSPSPAGRPSSTLAALASLGRLKAVASPVHRVALKSHHTLANEVASLQGCVSVSAPTLSGRTAFCRSIEDTAVSARRPCALVSAQHLAVWGAGLMHLTNESSLSGAIVAALLQGLVLVVDDAEHMPSELRERLASNAAQLESVEGALVLVGAIQSDRSLPLVQDSDLHALGLDPTHAPVIHALDEGQRRWSALFVGLDLMEAQQLSETEMRSHLSSALGQAEVAVDSAPDLETALRRAHEALQTDAPRLVLRLLEPFEVNEQARGLAAKAALEMGDLEGAIERFESLTNVCDAQRFEWARACERLGNLDQALAIATPIVDPSGHWVRATALRALGRIEESASEVEAGLTQASSTALHQELMLLRCDLHAQSGDAARALSDAEQVLTQASGPLRARAEARRAIALAALGQVDRAHLAYVAALDAASLAGDPSAVAAYVLNLATSHHARAAYGEAEANYQRASRLADRSGRHGISRLARVNLAGLYAELSARQDAKAILIRLSREESHSPVHRAQALLIQAEVTESAQSRAKAAAQAAEAFELAGYRDGQSEARLVELEALVELGARVDVEGEWPDALSHRVALLQARQDDERGEAAQADEHAQRALDLAITLGRPTELLRTYEGMLSLRSLSDTRREGIQTRALALVEQIAGCLEGALRERFRQAHSHSIGGAALTSGGEAPQRSSSDTTSLELLSLLERALFEDEEQVLRAALDEAVRTTNAERAFLLTKQRGKPRVLAARNLDQETIRRASFRYSRSVAERVLQEGEAVLTSSATEDPAFASARSVHALGLRSILCVPVRTRARTVAALYLDHRFETERFGPNALRQMQALSSVIGLLLENARLRKELSQSAEKLAARADDLEAENNERAAEVERLTRALESAGEVESGGIIGSSPELKRALRLAERVGKSELPVLVTGESGTGKELLARFLHERSLRAEGPFFAINCGALPDSLLESELFGHVRGAFTGADRNRDGLFRSAEGGTLLLDEVGEMSTTMQTRLLRVLQEREVRPVGGSRALAIDVRVVAATNRDLAADVAEGRFRQDLYFRIVGAEVHLPALRDRASDIPALASHILERIASEPGLSHRTLSRAALRKLMRHGWPGNVRELEQVLRRAVVISESEEIDSASLQMSAPLRLDRRGEKDQLERALLVQALEQAGGSRTEAARALGVSRMTVHRWIKKHGL